MSMEIKRYIECLMKSNLNNILVKKDYLIKLYVRNTYSIERKKRRKEKG